MKNTSIVLLAAALALVATVAQAAKAPVSPEGLVKGATNIVEGLVVDVTSKTQKSRYERALGIHRDRVYTITLRVDKVVKGTGIEVGEKITIEAWQPSKRIPPMPGLQGHRPVPEKDDTVTVYIESKEGAKYKPILPNGITIKKN